MTRILALCIVVALSGCTILYDGSTTTIRGGALRRSSLLVRLPEKSGIPVSIVAKDQIRSHHMCTFVI
jgi:hypothetical protein